MQAMALSSVIILLLLVVAKLSSAAELKCYDHQTTDYGSRFEPTECGEICTVIPFFSPDHSLDVYLDVINSVTESIDIFTPVTVTEISANLEHLVREKLKDCA